MKAKEYYEEYLASEEAPGEDGVKLLALRETIQKMLLEVKDIGEQRKITTDQALVAVIREQHEKFQAFRRLLGMEVIRKDALLIVLSMRMPYIWGKLEPHMTRYMEPNFPRGTL